MMKPAIVAFLFWPLLALAQEGNPPKVAASDTPALLSREGETVVVTGFVESGNTSPAGINFLNFRESRFVCVTFGRNLSAFPDGPPAQLYEGKQLEVRGKLELYRGSPQIKLESPDQVTVIQSPEAEPKVAEAMEPEPEAAAPDETEAPAKMPEAPQAAPGAEDVELVNGLPPLDWRKYFGQGAEAPRSGENR